MMVIRHPTAAMQVILAVPVSNENGQILINSPQPACPLKSELHSHTLTATAYSIPPTASNQQSHHQLIGATDLWPCCGIIAPAKIIAPADGF
jgi:hypothetical protein